MPSETLASARHSLFPPKPPLVAAIMADIVGSIITAIATAAGVMAAGVVATGIAAAGTAVAGMAAGDMPAIAAEFSALMDGIG